VFNPYQFTGRRYDEESGQYYYRARMYSAEQARFTSSDPAKDGANWYTYVGNNPINARDPSGKWPPHDNIWDGSGIDYWDDSNWGGGGGGISLPPAVKCFLGEFGVNAIQNPGCYWLCGAALKGCIFLTEPTAIATCVGAGCICAAPDIAMAVAECL